MLRTMIERYKLLMFSADYCGPCRRGKDLLQKFHEETGVEVEYIDCGKNPTRAVRYTIQHVPTFILEKDGSEIARNKGLSLSYFYDLVKDDNNN